MTVTLNELRVLFLGLDIIDANFVINYILVVHWVFLYVLDIINVSQFKSTIHIIRGSYSRSADAFH